jgi:hypothetical protein
MNDHPAKCPPSERRAAKHLRSELNGNARTEARVILHRLWFAATSFLSMTAAAVLLARELPGYVFALVAGAMIPNMWLFSLHIVGAPLPPRLVGLNVIALSGLVFRGLRSAILRALGVLPEAGPTKALDLSVKKKRVAH